ncbi:hypothetical protein [Actinomadura hibisca]|uniref:hypothetical protein n=1 Tax=Actinomadura hibisca TaxID=68565 RepID=UPI000836C981|nr:hypothetical protein [Actinomadura hibisca]
MTGELSAADITGYLDTSGWIRQPEIWRTASVWVYQGEHEVIVPEFDGFVDGPRRVQELVSVLARIEGRPQELVAADIATPRADLQWYRASSVALGGQIGLVEAVTALTGARDVLLAAARAAHVGPRPVFHGPAPAPVRELLQAVRVGPMVTAEETVLVRVPLDGPGDPPLGRRALLLLRRVLPLLSDATRDAIQTKDFGLFDELTAEGVSAELCGALAQLSGPGAGAGFEIGFRWARDVPTDVEAGMVAFEPGSGKALRTARHRLLRLQKQKQKRRASVTGLVRTLSHDGGALFRAWVQGPVIVEGATVRRSVWARLPDEATYERAVSAHLDGLVVRANGTLRDVGGTQELVAEVFGLAEDD